ncbi:lipopolysaccharide heptosyltransferase II [Blochmannia endosymbiont of Polyrhachis (Hedomyrma) turneri]|uniref:lipopolysaccharide heptosyltransferase II n=1 Tax=Blochmannia endosymbiont of Polyrhachis (Hedomyrma) turneri TaxID=1505596 RepID=UPI00061A6588|nr:lipopolysaccharide heptosyltransferase II [Blochmannia endosymbiont of Polyrhachis (Hedomyrma) turneri]AKC60160.1 ADP-heptose--LPS heptosyltransferase 2 [Blochmannia endosymbiont of Polyrhachis (Hedomyrma) turneri]
MRILIIAPSWIGDAIMSQTMHRLLVQQDPKIKIDIIASTWNQALFYRMPEIHKVLTLTHAKHGSFPIKKYYQYGKLLQKSQKYQQSIILPNSFKSALIPFFAGIPKRTGWRGEMRYGIINDMRILHPKNFPLMIERYAALAFKKENINNTLDLPHPLPLPYLHYNPQELHAISNKFNITDNTTKIRIGICPGAESNQAKRWPIHHYARLILKLINQGYQTILLGSYKEIKIGRSIKNSIPKNLQTYCHNLIGLTSLDEAILLIKKCHAIISNDSGLMHIACALHKPVVALYGPSDPNCTPPLYHHTKIIKIKTHNTYKQQTQHSYYNLDKYDPNLINIQPHTVLETLHKLL